MLHEPLDFHGKAVLVNTDDGVIGRSIGAGFIAAGAEVLICGPAPGSEKSAAGIPYRNCGPDDYPRMQACVDEMVSRCGRLDVLICVTGSDAGGDDLAGQQGSDERQITLNLVAPIIFNQLAYPVMTRQDGGGVIINVTGMDAPTATPGGGTRAAAARGLANLAASLAIEWGPSVRVNTLMGAWPSSRDEATQDLLMSANETVARDTVRLQPATPGELVRACLFLASTLAGYVSGARLDLHSA